MAIRFVPDLRSKARRHNALVAWSIVALLLGAYLDRATWPAPSAQAAPTLREETIHLPSPVKKPHPKHKAGIHCHCHCRH